jgi:alpha-tubulin suppressor-like RCC1 family protein
VLHHVDYWVLVMRRTSLLAALLIWPTLASAGYTNLGATWQGPRLVFSVTPSGSANAGSALAVQPSVALTNAKGTVITAASKSITLAAYNDNRCESSPFGTLSVNTNPVTTTSGVSAFTGVSYNTAGTIYLKASAPGVRSACYGPITISSTGGGSSNPTPWYPYPTNLKISGPTPIGAGSCQAYVISTVDWTYGNNQVTPNAVTINLSGAGSGAFYSNSNCTTTTTTASIAANSFETTVYFKSPVAETDILMASDASGNFIDGYYASKSVTINTSAYLTITGPQTTLASTCGGTAFQINYLKSDGTPFGSSLSVSIDGYQAGSGGGASAIYAASGCGGGDKISGTGPVTVSGTGPYSFWYKSANVTGTLTFFVSGSGVTSGNINVYVLGALASKLVITGPGSPLVGKCNAFTVTSQDASSNTTVLNTNTSITLSSTGSGQLYSDAFCTASASSVVIKGGGSSNIFYLKDSTAESITLSASAGGLTTGNLNVTLGNGITPEVKAGGSHTCALMADQTVKCFGRNTSGQQGIGAQNSGYNYPMNVLNMTTATSIGSGTDHSCALLSDGTIQCWGENEYGQLGNGNQSDWPYPAAAVSGISTATAVVGGGSHTCALLSDQTVRCWGYNGTGQLGNNSTTNSSTAVTVSSLTGVTALAAGITHTCALLSGGTVKCWGWNGSGQLGDGTTNDSLIPVTVSSLSGVTAISARAYHTCALLSDQTVKCWGMNSAGQLGNGTTTNSSTPVAATGVTNVIAVAAGSDLTCVLRTGGTGQCWGSNVMGQLGDGTTTTSSIAVNVQNLSGATSITAGTNHMCVLFPNQTIKCWGYLDQGAGGNGLPFSSAITPVTVSFLTNATAIESGWYHNCAILPDSSMKCWGYNSYGQLGNGASNNSATPVVVTSFTGVRAIAKGGEMHNCVLLSDKSVRCWGYNSNGQLGDGTTTNSFIPVSPTSLSSVTAVTAGRNHSCALLSDQTVKCWGANASGQLGDNSTTESHTPVSVSSLTGVTAIVAGEAHTCALLSNQTVQCWGLNGNGQLGNNSTSPSSVPVAVSSLTGVTAISAGSKFSCALLSDQTVKCWGMGSTGQLGNGGTSQSLIPVVVSSLSGVNSISSGSNHSCALLSDQTLKCWGSNNSFEATGNGSQTNALTPTLVSLSGVAAVTTGYARTCALMTDQTVKCWGWNGNQSTGFHTFFPTYTINIPNY